MTPIQNPPPPPPSGSRPQTYPANVKVANVNQPEENKARPKSPKAKKILLIVALVALALATAAGAFFLLQERQDIREEAASSGQLICMPVDDSGNITNDKYKYDRMIVKNEASQDIQIKVQTNLCPYQGQEPQPGYRCDNYASANPYIIRAGSQIIIPNTDTASWLSPDWVSCQKIGQLDIQKDKDHYIHTGIDPDTIPDCFNTIDKQTWQGGVAFTIKANPNPCCPEIELTVDPNNPKPGQKVTIKAYSPSVLSCTELTNYSGFASQPNWIGVEGHYNWIWEATAGKDPGQYSVTFRGNTQDSGQGDCPARAIGEWCEATTNFAIGANITPTPSPSPSPSPTPTLTPTATPTSIPYSCECSNTKLYNSSWEQIQPSQVTAGQTIYIAVTGSNGYPNYQFDKGRIRVNKSNWSESDITTENVPENPNEFYITYLVPAEGGKIKIEAEVHLNATIADPDSNDWWR